LSHLGQQLLAVVRPAGTGAAVLASLARRHLQQILRLPSWPRAKRHKESGKTIESSGSVVHREHMDDETLSWGRWNTATPPL
jgi:hypothetical protein